VPAAGPIKPVNINESENRPGLPHTSCTPVVKRNSKVQPDLQLVRLGKSTYPIGAQLRQSNFKRDLFLASCHF